MLKSLCQSKSSRLAEQKLPSLNKIVAFQFLKSSNIHVIVSGHFLREEKEYECPFPLPRDWDDELIPGWV